MWDYDFANADDLIGSISLPISMLDLTEDGKTYTCLILKDQELIHFDAARLNLTISDQAIEIQKLEKRLVR